MSNRKKTIVYVTLLVVMVFVPSLANAQEGLLKDKKITIHMDRQPLGVVFRYLMEAYEIPIGFEQSVIDRGDPDLLLQTNLPSKASMSLKSATPGFSADLEIERAFSADKHPISVNIENGRLEEVLDRVVGQMENYKWVINDEVVNIVPIKGRDARFQELMQARVNVFSLDAGETVEAITTKLMQLPEFRKWLTANKLHFTGFRMGSEVLVNAQYRRKLESNMRFSDLSFQDLLNRITKSKKGGWILRLRPISPDGQEYIDLDI